MENLNALKSKNVAVNAIHNKLGNYNYINNLDDNIERRVGKIGNINLVYYGFLESGNDRRDGLGVCIYSDGSRYDGMWKNDKRNGHGRMIWYNNDVYTGYWENDYENGEATVDFANGSKYVGSYKNGKREGKGRVALANADTYDSQK